MRLNNGISKAVSLGLTILIALLALFLLVGVADTVNEVVSVARGYYSSYTEDSLFHLREEETKREPYLSAGRYFHDAMLEKALENGGEAYADEAARLTVRMEEEAAAMQDEECRKEIDEIIRKGVMTEP